MATPVMQVNNNTVPAVEPHYMGVGGTLIPHPPVVLRQNGLGLDITAGYSSFEWKWEALSTADFYWWNAIMLGQPSFQFSQARLYNYLGVLTNYTNAVLHRPTFEGIKGDTYLNVTILIDQLI